MIDGSRKRRIAAGAGVPYLASSALAAAVIPAPMLVATLSASWPAAVTPLMVAMSPSCCAPMANWPWIAGATPGSRSL